MLRVPNVLLLKLVFSFIDLSFFIFPFLFFLPNSSSISFNWKSIILCLICSLSDLDSVINNSLDSTLLAYPLLLSNSLSGLSKSFCFVKVLFWSFLTSSNLNTFLFIILTNVAKLKIIILSCKETLFAKISTKTLIIFLLIILMSIPSIDVILISNLWINIWLNLSLSINWLTTWIKSFLVKLIFFFSVLLFFLSLPPLSLCSCIKNSKLFDSELKFIKSNNVVFCVILISKFLIKVSKSCKEYSCIFEFS